MHVLCTMLCVMCMQNVQVLEIALSRFPVKFVEKIRNPWLNHVRKIQIGGGVRRSGDRRGEEGREQWGAGTGGGAVRKLTKALRNGAYEEVVCFVVFPLQAVNSFLYAPHNKSLIRHIVLTLLIVFATMGIGLSTNDLGVVLAFNVRSGMHFDQVTGEETFSQVLNS